MLSNADPSAPSYGLRKTGYVDCYLIKDLPVGRQQATECKLRGKSTQKWTNNASTTWSFGCLPKSSSQLWLFIFLPQLWPGNKMRCPFCLPYRTVRHLLTHFNRTSFHQICWIKLMLNMGNYWRKYHIWHFFVDWSFDKFYSGPCKLGHSILFFVVSTLACLSGQLPYFLLYNYV